MKKIVAAHIFLLLFLSSGSVFADEQSCESSLDISALPSYTPLLQAHLAELGDYFSCKAAVKEDPALCNALPAASSQRAACQDTYNNYYAIFGKLNKNGHASDEFMDFCLTKFNSKNACDQFGEVLLSGNADDCGKIEGASPEKIAICKDMASSAPSSSKAVFMMALRKKDISLCDHIQSSSAAAAVCRGLLTTNGDGCMLDQRAVDFKKLYCQHLQ